jgi:hypothetical protein
MGTVNIHEDRFKRALEKEFPGISYSVDGKLDMLNLRLSFRVSSSIETFYNEQQGYEHIAHLADRLRQDALVKTGASRIVEAANAQAEQYRQENVRLARSLQERDDKIKILKARVADLQDEIAEYGGVA